MTRNRNIPARIGLIKDFDSEVLYKKSMKIGIQNITVKPIWTNPCAKWYVLNVKIIPEMIAAI